MEANDCDGVRIGVRLTQYFLDERGSALIWVPRAMKRVNQLESRLRDLFNLNSPFCLVKGGFLLPTCENLRILQHDDEINVVPINEPFNFSETPQSNGKPEKDAVDVKESREDKENKKKKRKKRREQEELSSKADKEYKAPSPMTSTPEIVKKKLRPFEDPGVISAIENIDKLHAQLVRTENNEDDDDDEDEVENLKSKALTLLKELSTPTNGISDGRISKRKRLRVRKNKKNSSTLVPASFSDSENNPPIRNNSRVLINNKMNSHIRFTPNETSPVTVLRNKCKMDDKPRIINPIMQISDAPINGECPESPIDKPCEIDYKINSIVNKLEQYPQTNSLPSVDDIIMFKMLKMDEHYTPTVSGYIVGKVNSACPDSFLVKFSILDGHNECMIPSGKFNLENGEEEEPTIPNEVDLIWDQIIEPRSINS